MVHLLWAWPFSAFRWGANLAPPAPTTAPEEYIVTYRRRR
jgi:hypothetical protein